MSVHAQRCADELCIRPQGHVGAHELAEWLRDAECPACGAAGYMRDQRDAIEDIRARYETGFGDIEQAADDVATLLGILEHTWAAS